jgi:hypothetical protein
MEITNVLDFLLAVFFELTPFGKKVLRKSASAADDHRRQNWLHARLWHTGPHAQCCPKCYQAGYILALVRAGRIDLLAEYPELITVYEELVRDGFIVNDRSPQDHAPRNSRPQTAASLATYAR